MRSPPDAPPPRRRIRGDEQSAWEGAGGTPEGTTGVSSFEVPRDPELAAEAIAEALGGQVIAHRWLRAVLAALDGGRS